LGEQIVLHDLHHSEHKKSVPHQVRFTLCPGKSVSVLDGAGRADISARTAINALLRIDLVRRSFRDGARRTFRLTRTARNTRIFDSVSHSKLLHTTFSFIILPRGETVKNW
jgi:hypothetical protein